MNLISLVKASKDFGIKRLFQELNLHIKKGERLGVIGPNGAGKSTLLKVIAGLEPLEEGERRCSPQLRIEVVSQESSIINNNTVIEEVLANCGEKRNLLLRFNQLSDAIAHNPNDTSLLTALGQISEKMDIAEAWLLEQQCKEILQRLGINNLYKLAKELSGGYQKRVRLASALVAKPDILLLDEPTNHLDASAVEWLQSWLEKFKGALVLITHDRYVLDQVTKRIVEVSDGKAVTYNGNYSTFLKQKAQEELAEASREKKHKSILRRELIWLQQGPKARSTKQKARLQRIEQMRSESSKAMTDKLKISSLNKRLGKLVIEAESLQATRNGEVNGQLLFNDFSYSFSNEDRVGIIGANGSGKSTLLDLIARRRLPSKGKLHFGSTVSLGYLDQQTNDITEIKNQDKKVIDFIEEAAFRIDLGKEQITATQLLERFLFNSAQQHTPLKKLSGGEKRRLTLCRILIQAPNVLLLDEPTNDLDVQTLSILEDFLEDFKGCVVVVSHDRYFLDRTVDRIFSFEEGKIKRFEGNYSAFLQGKHLARKTSNKATVSKVDAIEPKIIKISLADSSQANTSAIIKEANKARRRTFKEGKELEELNKNLPLLEAKIVYVENTLTTGEGDLTQLSQELAHLIEKLKDAEDRWLELSELEP